MAAKTWDVRLFWKARVEQRTQRTLDVHDDQVLREVLDDLVRQRMGASYRGDWSDWSMEVTDPGNGSRWARVSVDRSGRTVIKR